MGRAQLHSCQTGGPALRTGSSTREEAPDFVSHRAHSRNSGRRRQVTPAGRSSPNRPSDKRDSAGRQGPSGACEPQGSHGGNTAPLQRFSGC